MNKKRYMTMAGLFIGMVFLGIFTIHSIIKIQSYGQLINYAGIIRGGAQRLVKLELEEKPDDNLISYLDAVMDNLNTGQGEYGLVRPDDPEYLNNLADLTQAWAALKEDIKENRISPADSRLLEHSESYFDLANTTVFSAQSYSSRQTTALMGMIIGLFLCILLLWVLIIRGNVRTISHLESNNKDLCDRAGRDTLTNAYTLEYFKTMAQFLLDAAPTQKYAVLYIDFEDFKYINDVFGYSYGDDILCQYAEIIQADLRKGEVFGRVSADNFVILRKYESKDEVLARQYELDQRIMEYMRNSSARHILPVCCGICCLEDLIENLKIGGLLDRANFARKTVKQGINQTYAFYDESIRQRLLKENSIRSNLETAFQNREFLVYYQPKILLATGKVACSEALVRWRRPDGEIISPNSFIPILERDHNIAALDQYVFEEVCKWLQQMLLQGRHTVPVSVNVSRLQFYNPDFIDTYVEIRNSYQIPHHLLEIEFTETIAFDNMPLLQDIVRRLKSEGFTCCIDDFGKGYSSLGLLNSIPVDVLKIDRDFFVDLESQEKDRMLVEGIIRIVRQLHITTVAEGIETAEQVEFLRKAGCDIIQGYVFHRPMPQEDFEELLENDRSVEST